MDVRCRIEMFGRLRVTQGARVIRRFRTQKTAALLAYLAYHRERVHPREVLMELLWPGCEPGAARRSLRVALTSLRHQLEPPGVRAGAVIQADRFAVGLRRAVVTTDVSGFEAALRSAERAEGDAERAQWLMQAIDLYAGELLPGYYQDWVITEQRRLADHYFHAVESLSAHLERAGDLERAVDYARRAVGMDPLREEGHRELMRLLAAAGQRSAALRQYRELERVLREELDVPPTAATRALVREIERRGAVPPPVAGPASAAGQPPLPAGTVTFLLTDLEAPPGDPRRAAGATAAHDALLREEFGRRGGREVKQAGHSFTAAFPQASDALASAVACQQALAARPCPEGVGPPSVRMALDTREVRPRREEAPGWLLRRVTGLLAAAHGRQILCSEVAADLVRPHLGPGVQLADLGRFRLPGVEGPERLFSVEYPGGPEEAFPPPKAPHAYASNLPPQLTAFFGREEELARLEELLLPDGARLVTLTGPGGSGKTRLALEAARHLSDAFRGAVWFAELQDLADPRLIPDAVLAALGVSRSPRSEALGQAIETLSHQPSLLVLDNFEHVVDEGAATVRTLLERAPTLTCLLTSRRRLELTGEREFFVAPLPTPAGDDSPEALVRCPSVELFVDRAQALRPDFQVTRANGRAIRELVEGLEGIPLALELAAARAQVATPRQMLAQLEHRFDFLVSRRRDVARRHRTLRAAMEWSYRLLSPALGRFFARLSVFRGGWTAEAAEAVCEEPRALDSLAELRECSLIHSEAGPDDAAGVRFRMLETLREYARDQLPPQEPAELGQRHAQYYFALAEKADLWGPEQGMWLDRLEAELDNFRAALAWYAAAPDGAEPGLRLALELTRLWNIRGYWTEGRQHLTAALARAETASLKELRSMAVRQVGWLAIEQRDFDAARECFEEFLGIARELDKRLWTALAHADLGSVAREAGDGATARPLYEQALAVYQEMGSTLNASAMFCNLGLIELDEGDPGAARPLLEKAVALAREVGEKRTLAKQLLSLGATIAELGDTARARSLLDEGLALGRELGDKWVVQAILGKLAPLLEDQGDPDGARAAAEESLRIRRELGEA